MIQKTDGRRTVHRDMDTGTFFAIDRGDDEQVTLIDVTDGDEYDTEPIDTFRERVSSGRYKHISPEAVRNPETLIKKFIADAQDSIHRPANSSLPEYDADELEFAAVVCDIDVKLPTALQRDGGNDDS